MASLQASERGLEIVDRARNRKGWNKYARIWADEAETSPSTLKRFWGRKSIRSDSFKKICDAVGIKNWEEIADSSAPIASTSYTWHIEIGYNDEKIEEKIVDAIHNLVKQISGDSTLKLQKVRRGSLVLVFEGSLEGFERIEYLFGSGQLTEVLGIPILQVRPAPVDLNKWLENVFEGTWQTVEEILVPRKAALVRSFRNRAKVVRAKFIDLGLPNPLVIMLVLETDTNSQRSILLQVHTPDESRHLPPNLELILLDESGEVVLDESGEPLIARSTSEEDWIQLELYGKPGEYFQVNVVLGSVSIEEYFVM